MPAHLVFGKFDEPHVIPSSFVESLSDRVDLGQAHNDKRQADMNIYIEGKDIVESTAPVLLVRIAPTLEEALVEKVLPENLAALWRHQVFMFWIEAKSRSQNLLTVQTA